MSLERQSGDFLTDALADWQPSTAADAWHWFCCRSASQHGPICFDTVVWRHSCTRNALWYQRNLYASLKSTFSACNGLQFHADNRAIYGSISIRLAVIASETREMSRNSKKIGPYSSSRSSKVIDLGVNGKPICDFLLVIIYCKFSRIFYRFQHIHA